MTNDGNQRTKNSEKLNSSFRISNIPLPVANVGFLLLQIYIGLSWIVVIYRLVSLGCQLEFLSLPPAFPRYPSFSSTTPTKDYWFTLGSEIIFAIGLLEVIFSIYGLYLIHQIQSRPPPDRQPSIETLKEVMLRALGSGLGPIPTLNESQTDVLAIPPSYHPLKPLPFNDPAAQDFREIHTNWFGKCHWQEIYRDNHLEWICGVLFCKTLEEIKQEDKLKSKENSILNFVEEILKIYENRIGYKIKEGYNLKLKKKIIRPTIDSIKISLKPLTITYSFAYFTDKFLKKFMIFKSNFKFYKNKNLKNPLNYFIKIPKDWYEIPIDQRPKPLFFIHGMGMGFLLYSSILHYLTVSPWAKKRPIIILLQPHISMNIFSSNYLKPPNQFELKNDLNQLLKKFKFFDENIGIEILSHSNGTIISGWIMKFFPNLIKRCCFIDPVCFVLWEGDICYNFLYSKPKTGLQKFIRNGLGMEIGMASYTHRYFNWPEAILWPHQIPGFLDSNRFIVILSGMDDIINSRRIRKYLLGQGMKDAFVSKETSFNSTKLDSDIKSRGKMISKINGQPICQYSTEALQAFSRQELLHRPKGYHKGDGGIIFDPYATHGETFMPGNPYFATIKTWLEGNGIHLTNEA